jgi:hypothetical protein
VVRAYRIEHHAAAHAAAHRLGELGGETLPDRAVGKDIDQEIDTSLRLAYVRRQAVDEAVIVVDQLDPVAAGARQAAKGLRESLHLAAVTAGPAFFQSQRDIGEEGAQLAAAALPRCGKAGPADQEIEDEAGHRDEEDEEQPTGGRGGRSPERHDGERAEPDQPLGGIPGEKEVGVRRRHVFS